VIKGMPMEDRNDSDLKTLREAASERDWKKCRRATRKLLIQLGQTECMLIAIHYAELYLPTFNKHHPEVDWPSTLFQSVKAVASTGVVAGNWPPELPEWPRGYPSPGSANFLNAIEVLWRMPKLMDDVSQSAELATDVISGVFMAALDEHWGNKHLDLWERAHLRRAKEDRPILSRHFWPDPGVADLDTTQWSGLADEIEKRLRSKSRMDNQE
jgi:hypothetical protein